MNTHRESSQLQDALKHHSEGNFDKAIRICRDVLNENPNSVEASHILGALLFENGDSSNAIKQMRKTTQLAPKSTDALYNLGVALKSIGKNDDAEKQYRKVLKLNPNHPNTLNNLANILSGRGDFAKALPLYERSISVNPLNLEALFSYGVCLRDAGQYAKAFDVHRTCFRNDKRNQTFREGVTESLTHIIFSNVDDALFNDLLDITSHPSCDKDSYAPALISALKFTDAKPIFDNSAVADDFLIPLAERLSKNALFIHLLSTTVLPDPYAETTLSRIRKALLLQPKLETSLLKFASALASQCFLNEYVYPVVTDEAAQIEMLRDKLEHGDDVTAVEACLYASYEPLYRLRNAGELTDKAITKEIADVIRVQLLEPIEEERLAQSIPILAAIDDDTSNAVRQQYEENPYPRWVSANFYPHPKSVEDVLRQLPLNLEGIKAFPDRPDILIAGCGTGKHAIRTRSRFKHNSLLAIDLSRRSLAYAMRKSQDMNISDIEFAQADILKLGNIDRTFNIIESSGVLHHMRDPMAGWKVLTGLLKHRGLIRIALYSEIARDHIATLRNRIASEGMHNTVHDIRHFRSSIIDRYVSGDEINDNEACLLKSRDFYTVSDCRDLLFHVQEHRFTLPQIDDHLRQLGLKFLGFEFADMSVVQDFKTKNKQSHALSSLQRWHEYELDHPLTFSGMYQFWCAKM